MGTTRDAPAPIAPRLAGLCVAAALGGLVAGGALRQGRAAPPALTPPVRSLVVTPGATSLLAEVQARPGLALTLEVRQGEASLARLDTGLAERRSLRVEDLPPGAELTLTLTEPSGRLRAAERVRLRRRIRLGDLRDPPDGRQPATTRLQGTVAPPARLVVHLDPGDGRAATLLAASEGPVERFSVAVPPQASDARPSLQLTSPDGDVDPPFVELEARGLPFEVLAPPGEDLRGFAISPAGVVALRGPRTLTFHPTTPELGPWRATLEADLQAPPRVLGELVLVADQHGALHTLRLASGRPGPRHSSPGRLVRPPVTFPPDGVLTISRQAGDANLLLHATRVPLATHRWPTPVRLPVTAEALRSVEGRGETLALTTRGGDLWRLGTGDGRPRWRLVAASGAPPTPAFALSPSGTRALMGSTRGELTLVSIEARDRSAAAVDGFASLSGAARAPGEWRQVLGTDPVTGVAFARGGDLLAICGPTLTRLDPAGSIHWRTPLPSKGGAALREVSGRVLVSLAAGGLAVLRAQDGVLLERLEGQPLLPGSLGPSAFGAQLATRAHGVLGFHGGGRVRLRESERGSPARIEQKIEES